MSEARTVSDQAILVLQGTHDGDRLAPEDLKLLENVVNHGLDKLLPGMRDRWAKIVQEVESGVYARPWFHGIQNLVREGSGYVYWRGRDVEHYSFRDVDAEKKAALRLASCCLKLEAEGNVVGHQSLYELWDRLSFASELPGANRYAVAWTISGPSMGKADVISLNESSTADGFRTQIVEFRDKFARRVGQDSTSGSIRYMHVTNQEQFDAVVSGIESDANWLRRHGRSLDQLADGFERGVKELVVQKIDRGSLPSEEGVDEFMLGKFSPALSGNGSRLVDRPRGG